MPHLRRRKMRSQSQPLQDSSTAQSTMTTTKDYVCFLAGTYPQFLQRHHMPIPHWAWINPLAHETNERILELAAQPLNTRTGVQPPGTWADAVAYLAGVILAAAQTRNQALAELQRSTLVPLELKLAHSPHTNPATPAELVTTVVDALYPSNA
jgi:hypothetical protein